MDNENENEYENEYENGNGNGKSGKGNGEMGGSDGDIKIDDGEDNGDNGEDQGERKDENKFKDQVENGGANNVMMGGKKLEGADEIYEFLYSSYMNFYIRLIVIFWK